MAEQLVGIDIAPPDLRAKITGRARAGAFTGRADFFAPTPHRPAGPRPDAVASHTSGLHPDSVARRPTGRP